MRCNTKTALALCLATVASTDAFWLHRRPGSALDMQRGGSWLDTLRGRRAGEEDVSDLFRALEELTTDLTSSASLAKHSLLTPGLYLRSDDEKYILSMDVPGIIRPELTVKIDRGTLTIHGRHECPILSSTNATDPFCIERAYDATFTLPSDADAEAATARMDAGVVKVYVPKLPKEIRATGRVLNLAEETVNNIYESAKGSAYSAYDSAAAAADSAKDSANRVYERAYDAAEEAYHTAESVVKNPGAAAAAATERVKVAAAEASASAASVAAEASASAASLASQVSATVSSVVGSATHEASKSVSSASVKGAKSASSISASASSASSKASKSASSASSKASKSAASAASKASASASSASAKVAEETVHPEHEKKGIYERVKEAVVGGSSGEVPVEKVEL